MKWYTCCNEHGLQVGAEWLVAAVESCLARTSLKPHLVYSGRENALTSHLRQRGVVIIPHTLSFEPAIRAASPRAGFDKNWAAGTFLRFDIPLIEHDDDVVLYTDTDVIFQDEIAAPDMKGALAGANEYEINPLEVLETPRAFNAGVLFLNIPVMRRLHKVVVDFTIADDCAKGALGWYDQGILNMLFREHRVVVGQEYNWRPFARLTAAPRIVHFHLLKPTQLAAVWRGEQPRPEIPPSYLPLLERAGDQYAAAVRWYREFISPEARAVVRQAFPTAPLSSR